VYFQLLVGLRKPCAQKQQQRHGPLHDSTHLYLRNSQSTIVIITRSVERSYKLREQTLSLSKFSNRCENYIKSAVLGAATQGKSRNHDGLRDFALVPPNQGEITG